MQQHPGPTKVERSAVVAHLPPSPPNGERNPNCGAKQSSTAGLLVGMEGRRLIAS
jgi:hypothetical protein